VWRGDGDVDWVGIPSLSDINFPFWCLEGIVYALGRNAPNPKL
jgi:hypothetical protein